MTAPMLIVLAKERSSSRSTTRRRPDRSGHPTRDRYLRGGRASRMENGLGATHTAFDMKVRIGADASTAEAAAIATAMAEHVGGEVSVYVGDESEPTAVEDAPASD